MCISVYGVAYGLYSEVRLSYRLDERSLNLMGQYLIQFSLLCASGSLRIQKQKRWSIFWNVNEIPCPCRLLDAVRLTSHDGP